MPFETRSETIALRADFPEALRRKVQPVTLQVRTTRNGPLISDHFGAFARPVALRWTALDAGDTSFEAFYRLGYAQDWNAFKAALSVHVAPAMNVLYADRDGNIGYLGAGRLPLRRKGEGTEPMPGWDDAYAWNGAVPPAAWPQSYNPASGYLVSANNKVVGNDYPYFISHDWAPPARAKRIEQLLRERIDAGTKLAAKDMQTMQGDTLDLEAAALLPSLLKTEPSTVYRERALEYLKTWNGDMRRDSPSRDDLHGLDAASAPSPVRRSAARQLEQPGRVEPAGPSRRSGRARRRARHPRRRRIAVVRRRRHARARVLPRDRRRSARKCTLGNLQTRRRRHDGELESRHGAEDLLRTFRSAGRNRLIACSNVCIGNGGSENSINVAASDYVGAGGYLQDFGPGFRQVMQLGKDRLEHYYMNSTGQSGDVMSRHYDDMVQPFRDVELYRLQAPDEEGTATRKVAHADNGAAP